MSKARKFRTKVSAHDDDEGQEGVAAAAAKDPVKKATKPSLLSFGDDDEGPMVAVKKKKDKPKLPMGSKFHQPDLKAPDAAGAAAAATHRPAAGARRHACCDARLMCNGTCMHTSAYMRHMLPATRKL